MTENLTWHKTKITKSQRSKLKAHKPLCLWFTGLSGSGKSTIANGVEAELHEKGIHTYLLDGDNIRRRLNKDLGFSDEDRTENIRRIGEVAKLFVDAGLIVITAFISPFQKDRNLVRSFFEDGEFIEVFVDCNMETCEERDPKGLYKKARASRIDNFTGIDSKYESPANPEIVLNNDNSTSIDENVQKVIKYLENNKLLQL